MLEQELARKEINKPYEEKAKEITRIVNAMQDNMENPKSMRSILMKSLKDNPDLFKGTQYEKIFGKSFEGLHGAQSSKQINAFIKNKFLPEFLAKDENGKLIKNKNFNAYDANYIKPKLDASDAKILEKYRNEANEDQKRLKKYEKETGIKHAIRLTNGTNIQSVGAVGEVARFGKFVGKGVANKAGQFGHWVGGTRVGKAGKKVVRGIGVVAGGVGWVANKTATPVKKLHHWNNERKEINATAYANFQKNKDKHRENASDRRQKASDVSSARFQATLEKREKAIWDKLEKKAKGINRQDILDLVEKKRKGTELSADEEKRFKKYVNQYGANANRKHTQTAVRNKTQEKAIEQTVERKLKASNDEVIKKLDKQMNDRVRRGVEDYKRKNNSRNGPPPAMLNRRVKKEVENELKKLMSGGATMTAEIKSLQNMLARLNNSNASYKRSIKALQEANKKLSKQVKNSKSKSALEQATKTGGAFGANASGK